MNINRYDYADGCMEEMSEGEYVRYLDIKHLFKLEKEYIKLQAKMDRLTNELGTIYEICSPYYERD